MKKYKSKFNESTNTELYYEDDFSDFEYNYPGYFKKLTDLFELQSIEVNNNNTIVEYYPNSRNDLEITQRMWEGFSSLPDFESITPESNEIHLNLTIKQKRK